MKNTILSAAVSLALTAGVYGNENGREFHVSKSGKDSNPGTATEPLLTLAKSVELAHAGDTVWVNAGTYRESVHPIRSGTGEDQRIAFRAVPGEEVIIKGSEQIMSWVKESDTVWKVELPNTFFGAYNPYAINIGGSAFQYGGWHHCGDVYLNGVAYYEKQTAEEVKQVAKRWHCEVKGDTTIIRANFGGTNPNEATAEINVRETLFWPTTVGLKYITVDGFDFRHAAANWAGHMEETQMAAVGPMKGKCWIIENCKITHARAVGIGIGRSPEIDVRDIDAFGDHIIRNNIIRRCGQMGIGGKRGNPRTHIVGNLIEDINVRREFGGDETAGIKLMHSVDTVIENNLIRRVFAQDDRAAFGIWLDYSNQGLRVTGNIIYDTQTQALYLEMNHGPILVDNNILIGPNGFSNLSEGTVMANNLFVDCSFHYSTDPRQSAYSIPHTTLQQTKQPVVLRDDKLFNNIFIERGFHHVAAAPGYEADYNAYVQGARKSSFEGTHSLVSDFDINFRKKDAPLGVAISFMANDAMVAMDAPLVNDELVGVFTVSQQTIEDRFGNPIAVDTDINGYQFAPVKIGPLADLKVGKNTVRWSYSKDRK